MADLRRSLEQGLGLGQGLGQGLGLGLPVSQPTLEILINEQHDLKVGPAGPTSRRMSTEITSKLLLHEDEVRRGGGLLVIAGLDFRGSWIDNSRKGFEVSLLK